MPGSEFERLLAEYVANPTDGERLPATWQLTDRLQAVLDLAAQEQGVAVDALVEHLLYRQLLAVRARLLVDEPMEKVPASFVDPRVAAARARMTSERALRTPAEDRGDRAEKAALELEADVARLGSDADGQLDEVRRKTALADAMLEEALKNKR